MKSKTSFFNKTIFMKNLTRFWPIWVLYLVIWVFMLPTFLSNSLLWTAPEDVLSVSETILDMAGYGGVICGIIFSAAAAAAVFSFMYNSRSCGFMASLPVSRENVYLTSYLSGLIWFIGSNLIIFLFGLLIDSGLAYQNADALLQWFVIVTLIDFVFYSIASFCAVIASNIWGFGFLFAAANCAAVIIETIIRFISSLLLRGITVSGELYTEVITPAAQLIDNVDVKYSMDKIIRVDYIGWKSLLIYSAVALLLVIGGMLIYRHRHMETASDFIAVRQLRPVFKYCATAFCALVLGMGIYEMTLLNFAGNANPIPITISLLIGGFVGYFGSSMLLNKSFRVFKKQWMGYLISAIAIIAFVMVIKLDVFGAEKYIPEADSVRYVSLCTNYGSNETSFANAEEIKKVTAVHKILADGGFEANTDEYIGGTVELEYKLRNGRSVFRRYYVDMDDADNELYRGLDELLNSNEAILKRNDLERVREIAGGYITVYEANGDGFVGENISLSLDQISELYEECIIPDIMDGKLGRANIFSFDNTNKYSVDISIDTYDTGYRYKSVYLNISPEAERTVAYLEKLGVSREDIFSMNTRYDYNEYVSYIM